MVGSKPSDHDYLRQLLGNRELLAGEESYLQYHSTRLLELLELVKSSVDRTGQKHAKVLEFGPHLFTGILNGALPDTSTVRTIGYPYERMMTTEQVESHVLLDLNDLQFPERSPVVAEHHVVVFCEVIEHLYTAPELVLPFVRDTLVPGGTVICSTPNAVSFSKRVAMLRGVHPYERIRTNREEMGHVREYTEAELVEVFEQAGFTILDCLPNNYWPQNKVTLTISKAKRSFSQGFTVLAQR